MKGLILDGQKQLNELSEWLENLKKEPSPRRRIGHKSLDDAIYIVAMRLAIRQKKFNAL